MFFILAIQAHYCTFSTWFRSYLREEKRHLRRLLHDSRDKVTFSVAKATVRVASSEVEAAKSKLEDCLSVVKCIKTDDSNNPGIISLYTFRHLRLSAVESKAQMVDYNNHFRFEGLGDYLTTKWSPQPLNRKKV